MLEKSNLFLSLKSLNPKVPNEIEILTKSGINAKFVNKLKNAQIAKTITALEISPNAKAIKMSAEMNKITLEIIVVINDFLYADSSEALSDFPALYSDLTVLAYV